MACVRNRCSVSVVSIKASALVLAVLAAMQVMAAENGQQRYAPGVGGSDMTSPLTPGWYVQLPIVAYHANKLKGDDGNEATRATPVLASQLPPGAGAYAMPNLRSTIDAKTDMYALLPRLTYLSSNRWLGANTGLTVMLPLIRSKASFAATPLYPAGAVIPPQLQAGITQGVQSEISAEGGSDFGIGDAEVAPIMHWEIGDHQAVTVAATLVLPTGDYNPTQRTNAGYGNYVTFRPSAQYAFIGDGWDVGARAVFSFNTRNKDTGYFSGNMFNMDYQLMKFVSEDVRVGLQGYFVRQLTKDTQNLDGFTTSYAQQVQQEIINGNKASVNAVGPAVAWLRNGGDFLLEGKFLKEFDARNRTEGQAVWLTLSKPM